VVLVEFVDVEPQGRQRVSHFLHCLTYVRVGGISEVQVSQKKYIKALYKEEKRLTKELDQVRHEIFKLRTKTARKVNKRSAVARRRPRLAQRKRRGAARKA